MGQVARHVGGDVKALKLRVFESALHAVADVLEGHAELGAISAVSAAKPLKAGALRALAVSAPRRLGGVYADAPTWTEQSVPCVIGQWRGIIGAQGITRDEVAYWEQALAAATASPAWAADLEQNYWTSTYKASADTRAFLDSERAFLGGMLRELGLTK
jgi:putative tricarboxylic transport membrane protein